MKAVRWGLVLGKELRGQWVEHSEQKSYEQSGNHYPTLQSTEGCVILKTVENIFLSIGEWLNLIYILKGYSSYLLENGL